VEAHLVADLCQFILALVAKQKWLTIFVMSMLSLDLSRNSAMMLSAKD
jgi:hypothetical protein